MKVPTSWTAEYVLDPWAGINDKEGPLIKYVFGEKSIDPQDIAYYANEELMKSTFVRIDDYPAGCAYLPRYEEAVAIMGAQEAVFASTKSLLEAYEFDVSGKGPWCFWNYESGYTYAEFYKSFKEMAIDYFENDIEEDDNDEVVEKLKDFNSSQLESFARDYLVRHKRPFDSLSTFLVLFEHR